MQNKTFKTVIKNDKKYNILALPGTNFFKFEIINMYGSNIERAIEKKYNKNLYGISHFIEHLAFKSTQDFTTQEILQLGKTKGVFNASTSYDRINYWFKTTMDKLDTSISFVCNTALNDFAKINQEEFDLEKKVVFNEAKRAYDNHQQMFYRNALREVLAYHEEDNNIGVPETIDTFTLKDAQDLKAIFLNHDKNIYNITYDSSVEDIDTIIEKIELQLQRFETPKLGEIEISDDEYRELLKLPIDGNYKMENDSKQAMTTILLNSVENILVSNATNNYLSSLAEETSLNDLIREKNGLTYGIQFYTRMISYKPYLNFSCDVTKGNESKLLELFKESISLSAKEFTKEKYDQYTEAVSLKRTIQNLNLEAYEIWFYLDFMKSSDLDKVRDTLAIDVDEAYNFVDRNIITYEKMKASLDKVDYLVQNGKFSKVFSNE